MRPPASFLWHDYETFGADPAADRPAQFAALRTDAGLEPVAEPVVWYCAPADDLLPHPEACLITGITPQHARSEGVPETEFAALVNAEMTVPATCSAGYNNLHFDDEFTRHLLYRNFLDPYRREWADGNSRFDLINLARMCYALRPEGIEWPCHEDGAPSFRLEDLAAANGIEHGAAHDALADVRATLDLARRVRRSQPRLFEWALGLRDKRQVLQLLDPARPEPVLHTSSRIAAARGCTTLVLPLAPYPGRAGWVIVVDLMADPAPLLELPPEDLHDRLFTPAADLPEGIERLALKAVKGNAVPMLAPAATLRGVDTARIGLDPERCRAHARQLCAQLEAVREKVTEVYAQPPPAAPADPDLALYSGGFFPDADRAAMAEVRHLPPAQLGTTRWQFHDPRLPELLFRYRARNYPETLDADELERWHRQRRQRLLEPADERQLSYAGFRAALARARESHPAPRAHGVLDQLEAWALELGLGTATGDAP